MTTDSRLLTNAAFVAWCRSTSLAVVAWKLEDPNDARSFRLAFVNKGASRALGLDLATFIGDRLFDLFPASDPARAARYVESIRTGEAADLGTMVYGDARTPRAVYEGWAYPLGDQTIAIVYENVTMRDAQQAELDSTTAFLEAIVENIPNMIFVKDAADLRFLRMNRAGEELLGISRAALLGKSDYDLFAAAQADAFTADDRKTLAGGKIKDIAEEPIQTANGELCVHTKKIPLLGGPGQPAFLVGISEDITERRVVQKELQRARDELELRVVERTADLEKSNAALRMREAELRATARDLERANTELQELVAVATHDLQEPLRKIQAFSDRARRALDGGPAPIDHMEKIASTAARMRQLIDDLLAFSRLLLTRLTFTRVELGEVLRQVTTDLEGVISETGGSVVVGALPAIDGHSAQLLQLFTNLVANALKFHKPDAGARVTVASRSFEAPELANPHVMVPWCEITVRDDGIGFDSKYVDRIFKIFERLHSREAFEGTGIGLAICRRVVERHGGTLTANSAVGEGATFVVTLPLVQRAPADDASVSAR